MARRLLTIPGIVAVNSWGGPTKEFDVDVTRANWKNIMSPFRKF